MSFAKKFCSKSPFKQANEPTKRYVSEKTSSEHGSSGGYTETEFGKGGRTEDKGHKSVTLEKKEATSEAYRDKGESDKPKYYQTKTKKKRVGKRKGEVVESRKEISEKKYRRKLGRKTGKAIKRGDDTTSKQY